jgi:hypothetical protein
LYEGYVDIYAANTLYYQDAKLDSAINIMAKMSSVIDAENADVYDIGQSCH